MRDLPRARYGSGSLWLRGRIWFARWRDSGVRHTQSTGFSDRELAQKFLNKKLGESAEAPSRASKDPRDLRYENIREAYLEGLRERKSRTLRRGKHGNLSRVDEHFAGWRLSDITVTALKEFRKKYKATGVEDATVNRALAALRRMFNLAVENEWLEARDCPGHYPMVQEPNEAVSAVYFETKWYAPMLKELQEPLRSMFCSAYSFGERPIELEKICWRDIDLKKRTVNIPAAISKTGRSRMVPLADDFALKAGKPDDLVFPLSAKERSNAWKKACVKLGYGKWLCSECGCECPKQVCPTHGTRRLTGLRYSGVLFRHLRHTAITNLSDSGLDSNIIKRASGHTTDSTFNRYHIGRASDVENIRSAARAKKTR